MSRPRVDPVFKTIEVERQYRVEEVADLLSCSRRYVFDLIRKGEIKRVVRRPKFLRVPASELRRFLAINTERCA